MSAKVIMWVYVCALTTDIMMAAKDVMWVYVYAPLQAIKHYCCVCLRLLMAQ